MLKILNKIFRSDYLNNYDPKDIKEKYIRLSKFYDDENVPFENCGITKEIQMKSKYVPETQTMMFAWECSRPNRVNKKLPIAIDWVVNLMAWPCLLFSKLENIDKTKNFMNGFQTHTGFSIAFLDVIDDIKSDIEKVTKENKEIKNFEIYGWSYGGAMAMFTHGYLKTLYPNANIYTFTIGGPRVVVKLISNVVTLNRWLSLKSKYQNLFMFQNANDIVSKAPFKFMCYRHIQPGIKLEKPFNIIKVFQPQVYHLKTRYDDLIVKYLDKQIEDKK